MTLTLRTYRGGDEAALVRCWNAALPADPITLAVLVRKVLCDPNFDPAGLQIAEADGEIAGFALALTRHVPLGGELEPDWAWITAFGVAPDYRHRGVGRGLLEAALRFTTARARRYVGFAQYAPNYFVPGIEVERYRSGAQLLKGLGFRTLYPCVAMDRCLVGYAPPGELSDLLAARSAEGYRFGHLTPADLLETVAFAGGEFGADWGRAVREAVGRGIPWEQFRIVRAPAGSVVGFAMYGGYDHSPSRFGPFGVTEKERGKGLGKLLLHQTMQDMLAAGLHDCWFLWTGEKSAAGHLYQRAGFGITRRFEVLRKELETSEGSAP